MPYSCIQTNLADLSFDPATFQDYHELKCDHLNLRRVLKRVPMHYRFLLIGFVSVLMELVSWQCQPWHIVKMSFDPTCGIIRDLLIKFCVIFWELMLVNCYIARCWIESGSSSFTNRSEAENDPNRWESLGSTLPTDGRVSLNPGLRGLYSEDQSKEASEEYRSVAIWHLASNQYTGLSLPARKKNNHMWSHITISSLNKLDMNAVPSSRKEVISVPENRDANGKNGGERGGRMPIWPIWADVVPACP